MKLRDGLYIWGTTGLAIAAVTTLFLMAGCATIEPDTIHVGVEHLSSISQHMGDHPTNYGLEAVYASAQWAPTKHTFIEVQDSHIMQGMHFAGGNGHEFFEARAGVSINLK